ncbi:DgyrCDS7999 [Dimorphilus gyrociliatus]|uniref:Meiotic nuclear division protein 1 homolog n=1 Tax=Dimorphilus gyrociliatus TaxID=2664684 RepID=A0A7I8VVA4_9ANNE|nr:DgyrCDS7999 [Dimorphilus gyrociliatus]
MTVKDVLQSLCDDAKVDTEKIGTSLYYWSFPSKEFIQLKSSSENLEKSANEKQKRISSKDKEVSQLSVGKEDTEERATYIEEIKRLEERLEKSRQQLKAVSACDPEFLEQLTTEKTVCKEAANRWTENLFTIKSYITNRFNIEEGTINKQFGIPSDLDYVE